MLLNCYVHSRTQQIRDLKSPSERTKVASEYGGLNRRGDGVGLTSLYEEGT